MRILHITPSYYPSRGGAETFTREVSKRLVRRSHDVAVLTLRDVNESGDGTATPAVEVVDGVRVRRFAPAGRVNDVLRLCFGDGIGRRMLGAAIDPRAIDLWAGSAYGFKPLGVSVRARADVVTVINWYDGWLPYLGCLARDLRKFALVGVPLFHTECEWARRDVLAELLRRCDAVVTMTGHEQQFVNRRAVESRSCPVGVGINPEEFAPADDGRIRRRYNLGSAPVVGYVGRIVPSKGVATLIAAMRRVWRHDPEVRLLLAGPGLPRAMTPGDPIATALAELSDVERARVVTAGAFDEKDKAAMFQALDLLAMPSIAESFGIAYLEAWMCGKAVIGSRIGSTECVIEDGVDGLLVTPGDPDDLAAAILRLLSNPDLRCRLGHNGRTKTVAHFTWDKVAERVEHVYKQLVAHRTC